MPRLFTRWTAFLLSYESDFSWIRDELVEKSRGGGKCVEPDKIVHMSKGKINFSWISSNFEDFKSSEEAKKIIRSSSKETLVVSKRFIIFGIEVSWKLRTQFFRLSSFLSPFLSSFPSSWVSRVLSPIILWLVSFFHSTTKDIWLLSSYDIWQQQGTTSNLNVHYR